MDRRGLHPRALLHVNGQKGVVFVAPALLPVMKKKVWSLWTPAPPAGDLENRLPWLNAEC
jgi:hypothetical protein